MNYKLLPTSIHVFIFISAALMLIAISPVRVLSIPYFTWVTQNALGLEQQYWFALLNLIGMGILGLIFTLFGAASFAVLVEKVLNIEIPFT